MDRSIGHRSPGSHVRAASILCVLVAVLGTLGPVSAQVADATTADLVAAVTRYAQFVAAHPLSDADRRAIASSETADLARHPADAGVDRRVLAFLQGVAGLSGPALEAARTSAWNGIAAGARAEGASRDPVTSTVLRYNPIVASDPRTGIAVSLHALQGYASSVDLTARLAGHPAYANLDAGRIAPALAATFSSYSPEAQRMVADGAQRWLALKARVDRSSSASLGTLRSQLAAGTATPADVARASQVLESSAMHETFDEMLAQTRSAFAAAVAAFGGGKSLAP